MTDEIKDANGSVVVSEPITDPIAVKDEEIAKLTENLNNYKHVALKRLGKLPGDADFIAGADEKTGLTVEETVKKTLLEGEFQRVLAEKDKIARDLVKENSELKLALKNRPNVGMGGGSGEELKVKDNILSDAQIETIKAKGQKLKLSGEKLDAFVEKAKTNLLKNR